MYAPPVVLDLDGDGLEFVSLADSQAYFDLGATGWRSRGAWVAGDDAFLARDLNGDGLISSTRELVFANPGGSDLQALAALDANADGKLDAADPAFASFRTWRDGNGNGISEAWELKSLTQAGIASILLRATPTGLTAGATSPDAVVTQLGTFQRQDGSLGTLGDVALRFKPTDVRVGAAAWLTEETFSFVGSTQADRIDSTGGGGVIFAGAGNDDVTGSNGTNAAAAAPSARAGHDIIWGGDGNDVVRGLAGNDRLLGESGNDLLRGGVGDDELDGGAGFDTASYSDATAAVTVSLATAGRQKTLGAGLDILIALENLVGSDFADTLSGDSNSNLVDGGLGNDTLRGDAGADTLIGGAGDDILNGGAGGDRLDGGVGVDMATWFGSNAAVQVDLAAMTVLGGHAAGDVLVDIENLRGTAYADRLTGDGAANRIEGQFGDDVILGGAGDDVLLGEDGSDRLTGGAGRDTMRGGSGADRFIYASHLDLSAVQAMTDVIEDFRSAERDLIDLAAIDANPVQAGDQALQFVGTAGLTAIGQVAYRTIGTDLLVEINLAGDATADAVIVLRNVAALTAADFIL